MTVNPEDPQQVSAELERRGIRPILDGEEFDPRSSDVVEVAVALNLERWARLGGGQDDDAMTAELINRGRLVDALRRERGTP